MVAYNWFAGLCP